ncbi:hypothetical protein V6N12_022037 [Hibiscus sabdariffa]|uniref:Uncharacterized protein n=1 Tax=Hibiscus sabdariffa TaxID=183260 RepID=A0ABR2FUA7_9ROSI
MKKEAMYQTEQDSNACMHTLENPTIARKTWGNSTWRLFNVISLMTLTDFSCLFFSSSAFALNISTFVCFYATRYLLISGMGIEPCLLSGDLSSAAFSNSFNAESAFFCLCSSACCTTMAWITFKKLLIPSDTTLSGILSTARCHSSQE